MTTVGVKRMLSRLPDLVMDVTIDHERQVVRMVMLELDSALLAQYVVDILPRDHGVVAAEDDGDIDETRLPLRPAYRLLVELAGREHPARVVRLRDGAVTVVLGDPDAPYLARCQRAIEQLLSSLHEWDIEAVVSGIDRYGRPEPNEGFLHLFARTHEEAHEQDVERLRRKVETSNDVDICVLSSPKSPGDTDRVIAHQSHFAWDPASRKVVRRNWSTDFLTHGIAAVRAYEQTGEAVDADVLLERLHRKLDDAVANPRQGRRT